MESFPIAVATLPNSFLRAENNSSTDLTFWSVLQTGPSVNSLIWFSRCWLCNHSFEANRLAAVKGYRVFIEFMSGPDDQ